MLGSGKSGDSDKVDGYHASTTRDSANTVPIRDANGYLQLKWINTNVTQEAVTGISNLFFEKNSDGYIRKVAPSNVSVGYATSAGSATNATNASYATELSNKGSGVGTIYYSDVTLKTTVGQSTVVGGVTFKTTAFSSGKVTGTVDKACIVAGTSAAGQGLQFCNAGGGFATDQNVTQIKLVALVR